MKSGTRPDASHVAEPVRQIVSKARELWREGSLEDVGAILHAYPDLVQHRTIVIELAYEEYLKRQQDGESLDMRDFAKRFPGFETSLYLFINVQGLVKGVEQIEEDAWPRPGDTFLGFQVIDELGRGTFARVFLASEDALGDRLVALKVSRHGQSEAPILGRLSHRNIVPIHSVQHDVACGLVAVCMPYLGRATLTDVLDRAHSGGRIPKNAKAAFGVVRELGNDELHHASPLLSHAKGSYEDTVVRVGIQLANALSHSHQRGIFHRDIKPSNVLMAFDGRPLLLDFNLSVHDQSWLDRVGGTLPYMAPEDLIVVLKGELSTPVRPDPRSEIFSLGVILYQLLCGQLPFEPERWGKSMPQVAAGMLTSQQGQPIALREANPGVSSHLEKIVLDCLAFEPDERIQTGVELANRLRRYFRPVDRSKRWVARHPWRVATAAALAMIVLAAWGMYLAMRPPYSERMFAAGIECFEEADYQPALDCFNEAVRYDRDSVESLMARGRVYLELEEFNSAFADLNAARKISGSPLSCLASGYSAAKMESHREALARYSEAFDRGSRSVALLNNMAYSSLRLNRAPDARRYIEMAQSIDPSDPIVCHNLLSVHLNESSSSMRVGKDAILAAERAAQYGTPSAGVYFDVARLYALASQTAPNFATPAVEWLEKASKLGLRAEGINDAAFIHLRGVPEYDALVTDFSAVEDARPVQRLIAPF